ncbi:MAG: DNA mismatch repair protein MutT [Candidatus Magasanikbacteria bacterium CG11_big_fil_rev_8_21_14_0_20_39_34]|uniref:DNA mismatch repair protein MutT n=1 Tax=Candidatus Magasanikbacteria bacterium CG11_big_fil_rev_8_21_14_0_20_39_34 TaxID=1974653 RepID=A0A2H0N7W0_9BACT|nr:MAG: DNA mismatch repair protein MutT [Candidatus Magasanikbacteria bacterium CG11_big_fil_rev_8_21_14_0_20_39_34]
MNTIFYIVNVEAAIYKQDKWLLATRSMKEKQSAGTLAMVGGKVENIEVENHVLEQTLHREILEEVGITIYDNMVYVKSSAFVNNDGKYVIDIVFLCQYKEGEAKPLDPNELSSVEWLTSHEIEEHQNIESWTKESLLLAEKIRTKKI